MGRNLGFPVSVPLSRYFAGGILLLWLISFSAFAETVRLEVQPGIIATASYSTGSADKPPVLILHGFLQTNQFPTVHNLAGALAESDFTVLDPTLSLGITSRKQSQPCEALHLQTLDDDVAELAQWVEWLRRRSQRRVVLMGHSAGGHVITRYLHDHPDAPVSQVVLISLGFPTGHPLKVEPREADAIGRYALGFCQKYPTTPRAFHSYVDWGPRQMLETMQNGAVRPSVILGSGDRRIKPSWINEMREGGVNLLVVEGANHFFDDAHEFDLLDAVETLLGGVE